MTMKFRKSLKFGNFFLCFVSKCWHECKIHRLLLERAAETTDTFLTKAILAKLRPTSWSAFFNCLEVNSQWDYM
jgi:hypothetical protein